MQVVILIGCIPQTRQCSWTQYLTIPLPVHRPQFQHQDACHRTLAWNINTFQQSRNTSIQFRIIVDLNLLLTTCQRIRDIQLHRNNVRLDLVLKTTYFHIDISKILSHRNNTDRRSAAKEMSKSIASLRSKMSN